MSIHKPYVKSIIALTFVGALALPWTAFAGDLTEIKLPGDHAYPESIAAAPDGMLYVSSPALGGVWRIKPQSGAVEQWIKPGVFGTRSTLGVLVDTKANLLWVCSNDFSSAGIPGPSSEPGSFVKGFDLASVKAG
jgi:DNA-binding beta-propeller fold protein YncE